MRLVRSLSGLLAWFVVASSPALARADMAPDPLRLVSNQTDLILKIEQPRKLVDGVMALEAFKRFYNLEAIHELYDSTNSRRFFQLIAYFEKQLGADRMELLDRLAGGGIVLAVTFKPQPDVLLVIQSKDAAYAQRFSKLALQVAEEELTRLESKDKLVREDYRGVATARVGNDFVAAVVGSALVFSNSAKGVHSAIDLHLEPRWDKAAMIVVVDTRPGKATDKTPDVINVSSASMAYAGAVHEARNLLPPSPSAWLWVNLGPAHREPDTKAIFDETKDNGVVAVFFGGLFNVAARAPYLCMGLYQKDHEYDLTLRFPRGRNGMAEAVALHLPDNNQASLPLLEPPHTVFSASYYLDLAKLWERRKKLLKGPELKRLEDLDKKSGLFLGGVKLSKLVQQAGPHQRIVIAQQTKTGYKTVPSVRFPGGALILEMRDLEFARTAETVARAAGLLASFQFDLKLVEEMHGKHQIVGYRFPEDKKLPGDDGNLRFNASPCLVRVGNQLVLSSTLELAHDLVDVLEKENKTPVYSPSTLRAMAYATGVAAGIQNAEEQLLTQIILSQALSPLAAREQLRKLVDLVEQLGSVRMQTHYGDNDFHVNFRLILRK